MAKFIKEYTSFASDIDLRAEYSNDALAGLLRATVRVITAGSGGLTIRLADTPDDDIALTGLTAGEEFSPVIRILSSGTSVSRVRVSWD